MAYILKNWREAATVLLVAKTKKPSVTSFQTTDFEILMLKRSAMSKFMPKLHVFPGGVAHEADFNSKWWDIFKSGGPDVVTGLQAFLLKGGQGAPMFSRPRPEEFSMIPSELAFRICAIRETFEESGILLVRDITSIQNEPIVEQSHPISGKSSVMSNIILKTWRDKINADAWQFIVMCNELNVVPDVWSLYEWTNWITPVKPALPQKVNNDLVNNSMKLNGKALVHKHRYDTAFYLCVLDYIPKAVPCDNETTELEWSSASGFIEKNNDPNIGLNLAPPQVIELGRLLNFTEAEKLKQFAWNRSSSRVIRWFPVWCFCNDACFYLFPGDELYPVTPDYEGDSDKSIMVLPETMEQVNLKYPKMNRTEIHFNEKGNYKMKYFCNIPMLDGQVVPISITESVPPPARL